MNKKIKLFDPVINQLEEKKVVDTKELEAAETVYIRDIENRVFQTIVLQTLSKIEGINLLEGNFLDSILKKTTQDYLKGIQAEQNSKNNMLHINKEKLLVVDGLSDFIVVDSGDVLLILPRKKEQDVKKILNEVRQNKGTKYL